MHIVWQLRDDLHLWLTNFSDLGIFHQLVPSFLDPLTDLSTAGTIIPTAVTMQSFFSLSLCTVSKHNSNRKKYYHTFHRGFTFKAWASCRDWIASSNCRCLRYAMKYEFNVIICYYEKESFAVYQWLTAHVSQPRGINIFTIIKIKCFNFFCQVAFFYASQVIT